MPSSDHPSRVLAVQDLQVSVGDHLVAVQDVSFEIGRGESVGLVGESGSGKTLTCRAVLGLLPESGHVDRGRIVLGAGEDEVDLTLARRREWNAVRGIRLGRGLPGPRLLPQPVPHGRAPARRAAPGQGRPVPVAGPHAGPWSCFTEVGLHDPASVFHQYPHELSGGMLQRVLIAISVSCEPELLIADEATTALDVVIQAEILELLRRLRETHGLSLLLVTHDLAVVAETCERIMVMYGGEIVESGPTQEVLADPQHPYTQALMGVASIGDLAPPGAGRHPGPAAGGRRGDAGLPVRAALPVGGRGVRLGPGPADRPRCWPRRPVRPGGRGPRRVRREQVLLEVPA